MSLDNMNRVPAGVRTGGQFAGTQHSEPALSLTAESVPVYGRPADETVYYRSRGEYEPVEHVTVGKLLGTSKNGWDTRFDIHTGLIASTKDESTFTFHPLPGEEPEPFADFHRAPPAKRDSEDSIE